MKKFFTIIYFVAFTNLFSQAPSMQWQKCFGGTNDDRAYAMALSQDGGCFLSGRTASSDGDVKSDCKGLYDYSTMKISKDGNLEWQKSVGGREIDEAYTIAATPDGGCITGGMSFSTDGDIKDHHGSSYSDALIVKYNSKGIIEWQKSYGGKDEDRVFSIINTIDGGYAFAAITTSKDGDVVGNKYPDAWEIWVVKLSKLGVIEWQKTYGGSKNENVRSIKQTKDRGYIFVGYSSSNDGDVTGKHGIGTSSDMWVVKLSSTGIIEWQKCYGGSGQEDGFDIDIAEDGGYVAVGSTDANDAQVSGFHVSSTRSSDIWVIKISKVGDLIWQKCLGGTGVEFGTKIKFLGGDDYIVGGMGSSKDGDMPNGHGLSQFDYWVVKIGKNGSIIWQKALGSTGNEDNLDLVVDNYGNCIISGFTSGPADGDVSGLKGKTDFWLVKLSRVSSVKTQEDEIKELGLSVEIINDNLKISSKSNGNLIITIFDLNGKLVGNYSHFVETPNNTTEIPFQENPNGFYIVNVMINGKQSSFKILK